MKRLGRTLLWPAFLVAALAAHAFGQPAAPAPGQLTCQIKHISPAQRTLNISCAISALPARRVLLRFVDRFAGVEGLSERVYALKVSALQGAPLPLELRGSGWYAFSSTGQSVTISYEMRLAQALDPGQQALVSSLGAEAGVLMPADLLPRVCADEENCATTGARVRLQIAAPEGWQVATTELARDGYFEPAEVERAVFLVGRLRERTARLGAMSLRVALAGRWDFDEQQVFDLAASIAREQATLIGGTETGDFLVALIPFPQPLTGLRSSAVTIGKSAVLLLNAGNNPAQTFAHYRRHLAHELFHFYLPNAFRIRENFDWFWEGFTRYIALLTLLRLRWLNLQEYLDAIQAEYEAYAFNPLRAESSLIAASPAKFANAASYELVYRKGMLVAALYDLELRWQSSGKLSVVDVMRSLYLDYARRGQAVGNTEVLRALGKLGNFTHLIRDDIEGTREIDWLARVKPYGLIVARGVTPRATRELSIGANPSARQRALFTSLVSDR